MNAEESTSDDIKYETDVWEKITYTWVIKDVNSCFSNGTRGTAESPTFVNRTGDYKWTICFESSESNFSHFGYLGVYLRVLFSQPKVKTKFTLSLKNSGDCVIGTNSKVFCFTKQEAAELRAKKTRSTVGPTVATTYAYPSSPCVVIGPPVASTEESITEGFPKFIERSELLSLIPDKILKIQAEILIKVRTFEMEKYVIAQGSGLPEVRLQKSLDDLLESSKFVDVIFEVEEARLKAHQCILSTRSPVFAAMFTHESMEKHSGVVKIVDFESDNFRRFLRFVYTGKVDIPSVDAATELFRAAEKYDFPDLKLLCTNFMSANLNSTNVGPVLHLAETFGAEDLKKVAINYMLDNIEYYSNVDMEVYKLIEKENPKLLTELLIAAAENFSKNKQ